MLRLMLVVLCATVAVASAAMADIAPNPVTKAQSLTPKDGDDSTPVSMDAERVEVTLAENTAHVKARFWMRNTAKTSTTLEVGFPDMDRPFEASGTSIRNLKVTVDGVEQEATPFDPARQPDGSYRYKAGEDRTAWFLWSMTFGPEQERFVLVEYDCTTYRSWGGEPGTWTEADQLELDMFQGRVAESAAFKKKYPEKSMMRVKGAHGLKVKRDREFRYVLATGAGWHGPIGKGLIEIKLAADAARCIESINPHGASWKGDTIRWTFKDLEPTTDDDIAIAYRQGTHHALGLKPGIDNLLAALDQRSHKHWAEAVELAKRIGTTECLDALGLEAASADTPSD